MKALLISIKPKYVVKILNGKKTIEVRKRFPKDYKGWVYIYCTKNKERLVDLRDDSFYCGMSKRLNGKVVARFYCDKVEEIKYHFGYYDMGECAESYILEKSCLSAEELDNYLQASKDYDEKKPSKVYGYAIHISNLEIFDKPKELGEFMPVKWDKCGVKDKNGLYQCNKCPYGDNSILECNYKPLTKAPQSYCFIEVEE